MLTYILITFFLTFYLTRNWYILPAYRNDWWVVEYGITEFSDMHYYWLMKGIRCHNLMEFKSALEYFLEAYKCKPHDPKVLFNLATTYMLLGNFNEAEKYARETQLNYYDENEVGMEKEVRLLLDNISEARINTAPNGMARVDLTKVRIYR